MSHDKVCIEAQCRVEYHLSTVSELHRCYRTSLDIDVATDLALAATQYGRQPPTLPTIHQKEHRIMFINERFKFGDVRLALCDRRSGNRVAWHGNGECVARGVLWHRTDHQSTQR